MISFWDLLQDNYMELNEKERKLNKRRGKLYSSFRHPNQVVIYEDLCINGHGKISVEKFADGTTTKYADCNYNGMRKTKKTIF